MPNSQSSHISQRRLRLGPLGFPGHPRWIVVTLAIFVMLQLSAYPQETVVREADLVHFGDVVDVDVVGSFEFDWRGKLSPEGFLDGLNTYGDPVYGLCRSDSDIAAAVASSLSKMLRDPKVIVRIVDSSNRAIVTLDGAVRSPTRFQLRREVRLRELLVLSGGIGDDASGEIQLFRPPHLNCFDIKNDEAQKSDKVADADAGGTPLTTFKISDLLRGKTDANPEIRSGDLITVLRAKPIYIIGGVNDPRPILSGSGLTLSRAIAMAGGLSKEADKRMVTIYRRDGDSSAFIEANLEKIAAKQDDDPLLKPFDIVEVGQRNKAKRKIAPVLENSRRSAPATLPLRIIE
ncbi:MAG: SLBB domain-containing protein [Acidobacteriota bacterium]